MPEVRQESVRTSAVGTSARRDRKASPARDAAPDETPWGLFLEVEAPFGLFWDRLDWRRESRSSSSVASATPPPPAPLITPPPLVASPPLSPPAPLLAAPEVGPSTNA
jgi:hypothetical protein